MPVIVLQLDAQAAHVTIDDVALRDEIGAPGRVEDLLPRDDAPATAGQQVQEALFERAQRDDRLPGPHLAVDDIEFDLAEPYDRHEGQLGPGRPPTDDDRASEQLLRRGR